MEGHASSINTDKYYVGESEELFNKDSIKRTYLEVMPYLTFFESSNNVLSSNPNEEMEKLKKELDSLKMKLKEFEEMNNLSENVVAF